MTLRNTYAYLFLGSFFHMWIRLSVNVYVSLCEYVFVNTYSATS